MWIATCMLIVATLTAVGYAYVWATRASDHLQQIAQQQKDQQDQLWSM
jgi:hypothetical protein